MADKQPDKQPSLPKEIKAIPPTIGDLEFGYSGKPSTVAQRPSPPPAPPPKKK